LSDQYSSNWPDLHCAHAKPSKAHKTKAHLP